MFGCSAPRPPFSVQFTPAPQKLLLQSQASPRPSMSVSVWAGLFTLKQLSHYSGAVSKPNCALVVWRLTASPTPSLSSSC